MLPLDILLDILLDIPRLNVSDGLQSDIIQVIELASGYWGCQEPLTAVVPLSRIANNGISAFCKVSSLYPAYYLNC